LLPDGNIDPAREHSCTISCLADTARGESTHITSAEYFWRSAPYKFRSQIVCPLEIKASCHVGPGYKQHYRRLN